MSGLTYVITGANRGIGKGLLSVYIARPNTTVIAGVRDVAKSTKDLSSVTVGKNSNLIIVSIGSTSHSNPAAAVRELEIVRDHFEVYTIGPLNLIQAFFPLLEKSAEPKFLVLTSSIGSMGDMESLPVPFFGYGVSKVAANYLVRKVHFETPKLTSMAFNPGWVKTDMGNGTATTVGKEQAPVTIWESVKNLVGLFDGASREKSGTFTAASGQPIPR